MRLLSFLLIPFLCLSCAPLQPHDSAFGDAGEVAIRVLICPLTLCTSELMLAMDAKAQVQRQQQQEAYARWVQSLTPEQQVYLEGQRINGAGAAMLGLGFSGGIIHQQPVEMSPPFRPSEDHH
jgi:hypothetical protein